MKTFLFPVIFTLCLVSACSAQKKQSFNLKELLAKNGFLINPGSTANAVNDDARQAVAVTGIAWLKGVNFSTGSIDVDLRGKNVFQQSFLGIAFHGVDNSRYECIYFRPFNYQSPDTLRRKHQVQYISEPEYPWDKLRAEHPLVYESSVNPVPLSTDWFHAHIVVTKDDVTVYVNQSAKPSLKVKRLTARNDGSIGLWNDSLAGEFANLTINPLAP